MTPDAARQNLETAIELHRKGQLGEAEALYRAILSADPGSVDALYLLGRLTQTTGRLDEAIGLLRQAIAVAPHFAEPHAHLGNCLRAGGQLDEAEAAYRRALELGDSADATSGLAAIAAIRDTIPQTRQSMDRHYQLRQWDYLGTITEAARYGIITGYLRSINLAGPVLDLGCGEGVLYDYLPPPLVTAYVGVDISPEGLKIHRAATVTDIPVRLFCSPLEQFQPPPDMLFASVIFNEVLYFVADPIAALRRMKSRLLPGGTIIVSWYCMPQSPDYPKEEEFWRNVLQEFQVLDMSLLTNLGAELSWRVAAIRPR